GLKGSDGGLPDSPLPECKRTLYAVIGFQPPMSDNAATTSPVGADASAMPAIAIAEGFNLGYCKAKPGKGPLMHNHDTNETFIPMTGKSRRAPESFTSSPNFSYSERITPPKCSLEAGATTSPASVRR